MFRKSTGESPHRFVLRLRVERAREMLHRSENRVLDVAVACGFKTQLHFARVFRQLCGASPTEYRQEFLPITVFETPPEPASGTINIPKAQSRRHLVQMANPCRGAHRSPCTGPLE